MTIHGTCSERFAPVREAFAKNFEMGLEVGASFAAVLDGELVVDLWGGYADAARTRDWERDTIVNVWSTTKTMAAITTLRMVDQGALDLDAPIARYWPEFGAGGKGGVLLRHALSHTSGVPGWEQPIEVEALLDWDRAASLLADQAPWWEPGRKSGYHALSQGYLLGEAVRRATGRTLGTVFREEIAEPLGADFHIGLAPEHDHRVAELIDPPEPLAPEPGAAEEARGAPTIAARVLTNPPLRGSRANRRDWRAAEIPAAGGTANARAVARVAAALACGGSLSGHRVLSRDAIRSIQQEQLFEQDLVLGIPLRWGLGFGLTSPTFTVGPNPNAFFWGGWGGSLVVIDPAARLAFSYVMNKMGATTMGDVRGLGVAAALYAALDSEI